MNGKPFLKRTMAVLLLSITGLIGSNAQAAFVSSGSGTLDWGSLSTVGSTATLVPLPLLTVILNSVQTTDLTLATIATGSTFGGPATVFGLGGMPTTSSASGGPPGMGMVSNDAEIGGANGQHFVRMAFHVSVAGSATFTLPYTLLAEIFVAGAPLGTVAGATAELKYLHYPAITPTPGVGSGSGDTAGVDTTFVYAGLPIAISDAGSLTVTTPALLPGDIIVLDGLLSSSAFSPIPVPASLPLLMGALVGLGVIARKRPA